MNTNQTTKKRNTFANNKWIVIHVKPTQNYITSNESKQSQAKPSQRKENIFIDANSSKDEK